VGYDLFLVDRDGRSRSEARAEAVWAAFSVVPGIAEAVAPRLWSALPDDSDCEELAETLDEEPEAGLHLDRYCQARALSRTQVESDPIQAAAFLDHLNGVTLVAMTLPRAEAEAEKAFAACVEFARANGLALHDPQVGEDVDLDSPGILPDLWK
jgi:predicted RNase H-like HicB family nuclease